MADDPFLVRDAHNPEVGLAALPEGENMLNVVVLSDVHTNMQDISRASAELGRRGVRVDALVCPGDVIAMDESEQDDPHKVAVGEGLFGNVMLLIEYLKSKCIFVPGNHDPKTLFDKQPPLLSPHAVNIHGVSIRLAPGLVAVGLGGSLDATRGESTHWKGFPYGDRQADFERELEAAFDSTELQEGDQVLLLTHVGPHACETTIDRSEEGAPPIYAGSKGVAEVLRKRGADIVANIHGHTHEASGHVEVNGVPVINPGALVDRRYGLVKLKRGDEGRWRVVDVQLYTVGDNPPQAPGDDGLGVSGALAMESATHAQ